mmetsp:Transcript_95102/g.268655  ORF Transcript_95102/g.268655 Transcript_95102/m.268655 type:complete len:253 (+) Transcript_95102:52-810(+)
MAGTSNKIFVGGLPQSCTDDVLTNYFMQYGTITDSVVMKDRETGRSRGFGFVTYDSTHSVDMVMAQYADHMIERKWVEVKRSIPQDQMPPGSGARTDGGAKGGPRMGDGGGAPPGRLGEDKRPGDWTCPSCSANVFASKDACFKCGTPKNGGSPGNPGGCGGCAGMMPMGPPMGAPPPAYPGTAPVPSSCPGVYPSGYYGMPPVAGAPPPGPGFPAYPYEQYPAAFQYPPPSGYGAFKGGCAGGGGNGYSPY